MQWFRLYNEIAYDFRIRRFSMEARWLYVCLLCCANENPERDGVLKHGEILMKESDFYQFLDGNRAKTRKILSELLEKNFVFIDENGGYFIPSFAKRQRRSDDVSERVSRHRKGKESNDTCNESVTLLKRNCNVTCNTPDTDTDTEYISTIVDTSSAKPKTPPCPHQEIVSLYHEICPSLQKVKKWAGPAKKNLQTRWNEDKERQNLEWWKRFFEQVSSSDYLMGRIKPWKATLIWLVGPTNFLKVLNGNYTNFSGSQPKQAKITNTEDFVEKANSDWGVFE